MTLTCGWSLFLGCLPKSRRWIACVLLSNGLPNMQNVHGHQLFNCPLLLKSCDSLRHIFASLNCMRIGCVVGSLSSWLPRGMLPITYSLWAQTWSPSQVPLIRSNYSNSLPIPARQSKHCDSSFPEITRFSTAATCALENNQKAGVHVRNPIHSRHTRRGKPACGNMGIG